MGWDNKKIGKVKDSQTPFLTGRNLDLNPVLYVWIPAEFITVWAYTELTFCNVSISAAVTSHEFHCQTFFCAIIVVLSATWSSWRTYQERWTETRVYSTKLKQKPKYSSTGTAAIIDEEGSDLKFPQEIKDQVTSSKAVLTPTCALSAGDIELYLRPFWAPDWSLPAGAPIYSKADTCAATFYWWLSSIVSAAAGCSKPVINVQRYQ